MRRVLDRCKREMLPVLFQSGELNVTCVHSAGNVAYALGSLYPKSGKLGHCEGRLISSRLRLYLGWEVFLSLVWLSH